MVTNARSLEEFNESLKAALQQEEVREKRRRQKGGWRTDQQVRGNPTDCEAPEGQKKGHTLPMGQRRRGPRTDG